MLIAKAVIKPDISDPSQTRVTMVGIASLHTRPGYGGWAGNGGGMMGYDGMGYGV